MPTQSDWAHFKCHPTPEGISKTHKIKWRDLPSIFTKFFSEDSSWEDVKKILEKSLLEKKSSEKIGFFLGTKEKGGFKAN
jgi:hypothetical protein